MKNSNNSIPNVLGLFFITLMRAIGYLVALLLRICGWLITKIGELTQKMAS